jgi:hypothetical protein
VSVAVVPGLPATVPIQTGDQLLSMRWLVRLVGLTLLAAGLGAGIGLVHRWYANDRVPEGLAVLVGLSGVALSLTSTTALSQFIDNEAAALTLLAAVRNVTTFAIAGVAAAVGGRTGDRLGAGAFALTGRRTDADVARIVRAVGRVITVELPEEIDDMTGFDPVPEATKAELAGELLVFPRRLTAEELRRRLIDRLKTDHGVGHVDLDMTEDGTVEYLALGSRESGLGPTLTPGTAAVAVRADPANAARAGDVVQVFEPGADGPERVTTAEVRGTAGDTVTLAVDEADADALDTATRYRLVTLPTTPRPDREFASLLRAAEETLGVATVAEGSPLVGMPLGSLAVAVAAVRGESGVEAIPPRDRPIAAGELLYAIARPATLRRLEAAARGDADAAPPLADSDDD